MLKRVFKHDLNTITNMRHDLQRFLVLLPEACKIFKYNTKTTPEDVYLDIGEALNMDCTP